VALEEGTNSSDNDDDDDDEDEGCGGMSEREDVYISSESAQDMTATTKSNSSNYFGGCPLGMYLK